MVNRWNFRKVANEEIIHNLTKALKIPESLTKVLISRGISTEDKANSFLQPSLDDIHNPFLMDGMERAVDRVLKAIKMNETIWIHGDYDVDGTASTAMLCSFLKRNGATVEYYIPDRFDEGYGLSNKSIDLAIKAGATLLITVDVGITAFQPLSYANSKDFDVIICDHHEPGDTLPPVYAILDPIKGNCNYPFKFLAACGVTFKFIQAIAEQLGQPEMAFEYLDFVALSSAADMVPLIDENRALVHYGLKLLNRNPRPGIKGLVYCTGLKQGMINATNIVYAIAPLINAAGRLGDAKRSVEMMLQEDEIAAFQIAQQLEDENRKRRLYDQQTFEEAIPIAENLLAEKDRRSLVIHHPHWHAGVIGIVASRLVDRFHLPTVLLTTIEGVAKGSARSISDFDVHTALKQCEDLLVEFGGHKHAAGLSIKEENIREFRERFDAIAALHITKDMLMPEIMIDSELKLNELSPKFFKILNLFAPFGFENQKPVFYSRNVRSINGVKIVGNNNIKFRAFQNNFVIDAIGHNLASKIHIAAGGKPFSIVYNLETINFNGQRSPQLTIKDIRLDEADK
ncbi:MAG: single-stranded-DNA-specific exonuclease RecJ [Bacteroidota bacterium]